jgi:ElaB/YqjD/DUF883 family membrane-anchored ribosome-binding protein
MAMSRTAEKTRTKAEDVLSELEMRQRIDDLKEEIASISRTLAALGGQKVDDYRDTLEKLSSDAVAASLKAFDTARSEALSLEEGFERQVREHPLRAIGIAAGIGFLFALMSRR